MTSEPQEPVGVDCIAFYLCFGKLITRVSAKRSSHLRVLEKLLNKEKVTLIYKGQVLSMDKTFECYKIRDMDTIIAVPLSESEEYPYLSTITRWQRVTYSDDNFADLIRAVMNPSSRAEAMRVRDLSIFRSEMRPRQYRRIMRREMVNIDTGLSSRGFESVIPEPASEMPTSPLPVTW
jgi:hypothetical protein